VVTQQLIPGADNRSRVLALEVLVVTPAVSNMVRDGKTFQVPQSMQTGSRLGMQLMDDHLLRLVDEFKITHETAISRCTDPTKFPTLEEMRAKMVDWTEFLTMDDKARWKMVGERPCLEYKKETKEWTIIRPRIPFVFFTKAGQLPAERVAQELRRLCDLQGEKKGWL